MVVEEVCTFSLTLVVHGANGPSTVDSYVQETRSLWLALGAALRGVQEGCLLQLAA